MVLPYSFPLETFGNRKRRKKKWMLNIAGLLVSALIFFVIKKIQSLYANPKLQPLPWK